MAKEIKVEYKVRESAVVVRVKFFTTQGEAQRWVAHQWRTNPRFLGVVEGK